MKKLTSLVSIVAAVGVTLGGFAALVGNDGMFGSRGTYDVERFSYHGGSAKIVAEDVRFGPDKYFLQVDGKDKIEEGSLTGDDGKFYSVLDDGRRYSVKEK